MGDGRVKCGVCPHHCVIAEGKRGICAVRENREGTLYALNYGKAIAVAIDPIEKKPLNYFLPGTTAYSFATIGCNLRCLWCQNWAISQASKPNRLIYGEDISPDEHVRRALAAGCPSIAYTYTEPIIFVEYALDTMKLAREAGLKNIWKTAGYATKETLNAIIPYLDAVNVDLKGTDDEVYKEYCGGTAQPVLDTIIRFHESGVHLEIATLVVPGVNDRIDQLERMARFIASADLSHVLKPAGPYGYHSAGPLFDKLVIKAIKEKDAGQLLRLDAGFLEGAAECGLRSILFLMGAFEGRAYEAEVLSYEGPFGVGYLVATFMPSESEEQIKDA